LTGSYLEVAVEGRKLVYTIHFISYEAAACSRRQSRDRKWWLITSGYRKWRHLTKGHLEVAVESLKLTYTLHCTSYNAGSRSRRQPRHRKWCHVTRWIEITWK